jgi:hypothetical protein
MVPFRPEHYGDLQWIQTGALSRIHELKCGDSVVARLEFKNMFGSLAEGSTTEGVWTFKRRGLVRQTVFVRPAGTREDIITYEPNWSKRRGVITVPGGLSYNWEAANFWCSDWTLSKRPGGRLVSFRNKGIVKASSAVVLAEGAKEVQHLDLLLMLGCFLAILHRRDSAAAAS